MRFQGSRLYYFFGEDGKSTMEHISRFIAQCTKASQNNFLRLQLFPLSLARVAFIWYLSFSPNSVQSWADTEYLFHNRFFKPQPEASVLDLLGIKQQANELIIEILERFRRVKGKYSVQLPEAEYAFIIVNNMKPQLREKLIISKYGDLA